MSTDQLLNTVLKEVPDADPATILDLIVACEADLTRVFRLLGVATGSTRAIQRQATFKVTKGPRNITSQRADILPRAKVKAKSKLPREPIYLHTSEQVADANICCTLHRDVLEPSVANLLAMQLLEDSPEWPHAKFHLFDREVMSHHSSATYTDDRDLLEGRTAASYQGSKIRKVWPFTPEMSIARDTVVDKVGRKTPPWNCNMVITNRYSDKKEHLMYHSDQLTHLGPRPIIATLTLGCAREFRLQPRRPKSTDPSYYSVTLPHNSMLVMREGCQEYFKHCVPPARTIVPHPLLGSSRLSLTFRHYLTQYSYENLPRCRCNMPMILRTTLEENFRYIWQCGAAYKGGTGCGEVREFVPLH